MVGYKTMLVIVGLLALGYIVYKALFSKDQFEQDYDKLYDKVLTSKEYKVKGQYEK